MRRLFPLVLAGALAACGPEFDPPSEVGKLRLLAVKAEPPEIAPGGVEAPDRTTIASLVADPAQLLDEAREATVLHLACTPDPRDPSGGVCTSLEALRDPAAIAAVIATPAPGSEPGRGTVGGTTLVGVEACDGVLGCRAATVATAAGPVELPLPVYVLPEDLDLAGLPAGFTVRVNGVQISLLSIAVAATPDELFAGGDVAGFSARLEGFLGSRESVIALKRIQVRGPDALDPPNRNPSVPGILAAGAPLPAPLPEPPPPAAVFAPGSEAALLPRAPAVPLGPDGEPADDEVWERYTRTDAFGNARESLVENWLYSWYGTAGSFERDRTRADETNGWTVPDDDLPPGGRAFLYLVVRDTRGGLDWAVREVRVE